MAFVWGLVVVLKVNFYAGSNGIGVTQNLVH